MINSIGVNLYDYQFRVIVVGDSTVGKSSLVKYFSEGKFITICDPTVGVDFFSRCIALDNGIRIKLQLWDTAGQEKFRSITKSYYRSSVACLLVFDLTNRDSFEHLAAWHSQAMVGMCTPEPVFLVVGHKTDLADSESLRRVSKEEAKNFATERGLKYVETSALTGQNVEAAFISVGQDIYDRLVAGRYNELMWLEGGWDGVKVGDSRDVVLRLDARVRRRRIGSDGVLDDESFIDESGEQNKDCCR